MVVEQEQALCKRYAPSENGVNGSAEIGMTTNTDWVSHWISSIQGGDDNVMQ